MRILASVLFATLLAGSVGCSDGTTTDTASTDAADTATASDSASADARVTCGSPCTADPGVCQAQIGGRAYCDTMTQTCACPP